MRPDPPLPPSEGTEPTDESGPFEPPDQIVVEITDVIDLHTFRPDEMRDVVRDYLDAAHERGLRQVRIIHGRGIGVQRRSVRSILAHDPRVVDFRDAPSEDGGPGATLVTLE
jgi:DNA-nicking Smr family endonuclease